MIGSQERKIKCFWGGMKCFGYKNIKETETFCNGPEIIYKFSNSFSHDPKDLDGRKFKLQLNCEEKSICRNNWKKMVKECDSELKWTKSTILHSNGNTLYRFCYYEQDNTIITEIN